MDEADQEPREPQTSIPLETDDRFPSGNWVGFFTQDYGPGGKRHDMELILTFRAGKMTGEGQDWVGEFQITGRYDVNDGKCQFHKRYVSKHDVAYLGYNEGKGIYGKWEIPPSWHGGFHIWPEAMGDPTQSRLEASQEVPTEALADFVPSEELEPAGV